MNDAQHDTITQFFAAVEELKRVGVARTDRYLGDIGEFLCSDALAMTLTKSAREKGYDGHISGEKVQVKYHGGKSTTVDCGDPSAYARLLVVIGPKSVLRPKGAQGRFLIYQLTPQEVRRLKKGNGKYLCLKSNLPREPALVL